jgi:riboflavin synthase
MFTGIVAAVGNIKSVTPLESGVRLDIDAGGLPLADVALGDSITVNGACMTVVEKTDTAFSVDVSRESLDRTAGLDKPGEVNLEKALTLAERLGGHLVSGHVDGRSAQLRTGGRIAQAGDRRADRAGQIPGL